MRYGRIFTALALGVALGCSRSDPDGGDCLCGVVTGTVMDQEALHLRRDLKFRWYNDYASATEALLLGKVDGVPVDTVIARQWVARRPDEFAISVMGGTNPYGYFFPKGSPLRDSFNAELRKLIASGFVERIVVKWCDAADLMKVPEEPLPEPLPPSARVLRFSTSCEEEPGSFIRDGRPVGFDIDIVRHVACKLGMAVEVVRLNHVARITAVQSGKADFGGGCVTITDERAKRVDYTDCYYDGGFAMLVARSSVDRAAKSPRTRGIRSPEDLGGLRCGAILGSVFQDVVARQVSGVTFVSFNDTPSAVEALRIGKVDFVPIDGVIGRQWATHRPDELRVALLFGDNPYAFFFRKGSALRDRVDAVVRRLRASGEIDRIVSKWCEAPDLEAVASETCAAATGKGGRLRFATYPGYEPGIFVRKDGIVGFEADIVRRIAAELDMELEFVSVTMSGLIAAVESGTAEMGGGCTSVTAERARKVDFSDSHMNAAFAIMVRNEDMSDLEDHPFLVSLTDSFRRTFVDEGRWRMLAHGFGVTLLIALLSSLIGTVLAFPVWLARTSRFRFVVACARAYISVLQGTPVLVLLMVLFYLVFGRVEIDGIWVAVIGFALNGSAYIGETLRSGIASIPRGQTEAALALGYTPGRAFFRFVLPQAVRLVLPVYRGELIAILKATSIVGYIAINDLTKASDLVRSRTYESFFPILTTAFVYFAAAYVLAIALDRFGRRLDPGRRRARK